MIDKNLPNAFNNLIAQITLLGLNISTIIISTPILFLISIPTIVLLSFMKARFLSTNFESFIFSNQNFLFKEMLF